MVATTETVVFGAGYLGQRIAKEFGCTLCDMEVIDIKKVSDYLDTLKPQVVINCIGTTGRPNIDWCETHKEETILGNITVPTLLGSLCAQKGIFFVHLGSGCIYQGDNDGKGYAETDPPNHYGSFYSKTKIYSEQILRDLPCLQLRLRMPIDDVPHPRNLINKLKGYSQLIDEPNSMTSIPSLLHVMSVLVAKRRTGVYNVVNPGTTSPYRIMQLYKDIVDDSVSFSLLSVEGLGKVVKATRSNTVLNTDKLRAEGIELPDINDAVRACLVEYRRNAQ